jgi:hypothetical protein
LCHRLGLGPVQDACRLDRHEARRGKRLAREHGLGPLTRRVGAELDAQVVEDDRP